MNVNDTHTHTRLCRPEMTACVHTRIKGVFCVRFCPLNRRLFPDQHINSVPVFFLFPEDYFYILK